MQVNKVQEYHSDQWAEVESFLRKTGTLYRQNMLQDSPRRNYAIYTCSEQQINGLLISWHNSFHPYADYITLILDPEDWNDQAAGLLLDEAIKRSAKSYLQVSIQQDGDSEPEFYKSRQFTEVRRTYTSTLDIQEAIQAIPPTEYTEHYKTLSILNLRDWQQHDPDYSRLAQRVYDDYRKVHTVNLPAPLDIRKWTELLQADDIVQEGSYIAYSLHRDEIRGYALMHKSGEENCVELGWSDQGDTHGLKFALVQQQLHHAWQQGYICAEIEIDNTDPDRMELLTLLPFQSSPALITYQYRK